MNIEVNKTNVKVEGNNLVIELTEELRKSLGMRQSKPCLLYTSGAVGAPTNPMKAQLSFLF